MKQEKQSPIFDQETSKATRKSFDELKDAFMRFTIVTVWDSPSRALFVVTTFFEAIDTTNVS